MFSKDLFVYLKDVALFEGKRDVKTKIQNSYLFQEVQLFYLYSKKLNELSTP